MANPSEAEVQATIQDLAKWLWNWHLNASVNSPNIVGIEDEAAQAIEGDFTPLALSIIRSKRRTIANMTIGAAAIREVLDPAFQEYGKIYGLPETRAGGTTLVRRVMREWAEAGTPVTVLSRASISLGSPADPGTPSNTGTGVHLRCTTDAYGYTLQGFNASTLKKSQCIRDAQTGAIRHEEVFEIRDGDEGVDAFERRGTGQIGVWTCPSGRTAQQFLSNPSFSLYTGAAATPTEITDWTVTTSINNFEIVTSDYFRDFEGDVTSEGDTSSCVEFEDNDSLTQILRSTVRPTFSYDVPYLLAFAIERKNSCDGTLTAYFGASSVATTMSSLTNDVWNRKYVAMGTGCWARNFNETDMDVKFTLASRTTGECRIDDVIIAPMLPVGGSYHAIIGGATAFLARKGGAVADRFTWTDSITTDAKILHMIWQGYGITPPHDGTPVIADP